mgnify:CR=1 FL=1
MTLSLVLLTSDTNSSFTNIPDRIRMFGMRKKRFALKSMTINKVYSCILRIRGVAIESFKDR